MILGFTDKNKVALNITDMHIYPQTLKKKFMNPVERPGSSLYKIFSDLGLS